MKILKKLFVVSLCFSSLSLAALPLHGPEEPAFLTEGIFFGATKCIPKCDTLPLWQSISLRCGFYGDFVFNRNLKTNCTNKSLQDTKINTLAAYFALNICNRVDLFATVGESTITLDSEGDALGFRSGFLPNLNFQTKILFSESYSWSVGTNVKMVEYCGFSFGLEGEYLSLHPKPSLLSLGVNSRRFESDANPHYEDWQIGLGISYRVRIPCPTISLYPYMGTKCSWARFDMDHLFIQLPPPVLVGASNFTVPNLKANKLWGYVIGLSLTVSKRIAVSVEGRFGDEEAFSTITQVRF